MTARLYDKHAMYNARMTGSLLCYNDGTCSPGSWLRITCDVADDHLKRGAVPGSIWVDVPEVQSTNQTLTELAREGWIGWGSTTSRRLVTC